ncbi:MAG: hypothetical protein QXZ02_06530 [Candidatus Bathyarchaeia archaeon]
MQIKEEKGEDREKEVKKRQQQTKNPHFSTSSPLLESLFMAFRDVE